MPTASELLDEWRAIGETVSFMNQNVFDILFYVIFGQYLNKTKVRYFGNNKDLRLHTLIVMPTRTGKGQASGAAKTLLKELNIKFAKRTTITDTGLIGQIDYAAVESNTKTRSYPGSDKYREPIVYGDLFNYDVMIFDEAKQMIKIGKYTESILEILQEAMDSPGIVSKKVGYSVPIEFETKASIIAYTYYLQEFKRIFLEQGITQRMILYVEGFDFDKRVGINDAILDNIIRPKDTDGMIRRFKERMHDIKVNAPAVISLSKQSADACKSIVNGYLDMFKESLTPQELHIMAPFSTSMIEIMVKIATINAAIEKRSVISPVDITFANRIVIYKMISSLTNEVLTKSKLTKDMNYDDISMSVLRLLQQKGPMSREGIIQAMSRVVGNRNLMSKVLQRMVKDRTVKTSEKKSGVGRPLTELYV